MLLDLKTVSDQNGASKAFEGTVDFGTVSFQGSTYRFCPGAKVNAKVENLGGTLELTASVAGQFQTACARCQEEVTLPFLQDLTQALVKDGAELGDDEAVQLVGNTIDITELLLNEVLANLQMVYLCSDSCKGLCPTCGTNLNKEVCGCDNAYHDPRFDVLKQIKFD